MSNVSETFEIIWNLCSLVLFNRVLGFKACRDKGFARFLAVLVYQFPVSNSVDRINELK